LAERGDRQGRAGAVGEGEKEEGAVTKVEVLARIDQLLVFCSSVAEPEMLLNGALTLMTALYGPKSEQADVLLKRRDDLRPEDNSFRKELTARAVGAALQNLRAEVEGGLLSSLERRIASDVLSDLIQLARAALDEPGEGPKNVAAVLAAAAYEDTIRRVAKEHAGVIGQDKLDVVIGKLKDAGLLVAPQLGIALSYLNFRNHALHAQWNVIDRAAVQSVLGFVEQLLLKHFS